MRLVMFSVHLPRGVFVVAGKEYETTAAALQNGNLLFNIAFRLQRTLSQFLTLMFCCIN